MGVGYLFTRSLRKILPGLAMAPFALDKSSPSPSSQGSGDEIGDRRLRMVREFQVLEKIIFDQKSEILPYFPIISNDYNNLLERHFDKTSSARSATLEDTS